MTDPSQAGTIVVSGTGRIAVDPDVADLRLGVAISRDRRRGRPRRGRDDGCHPRGGPGAGVAERDVRTTVLSVQPRYDYRDGKAPVLVGYDLANVVEVTVRDLSTLGGVVDGALTAGATSLDGLTFRVDDPRDAEHAARTAAIVEARARADVLAAAAGVSITGVSDITEGGPQPTWPQPKAPGCSLAADAGTPVEAGTHRDRGHRHGHVPDRADRRSEQLAVVESCRRVDGPVLGRVDRAERPTEFRDDDRRPRRVADGVDHPQVVRTGISEQVASRRGGPGPDRGPRRRR